MMIDKKITSEDLLAQNLHWQHGSFVVPDKKRLVFDQVLSQLDLDPLLLITGPRRVGKSVLLKQLINYLIQTKHVQPQQILFFEFGTSNTMADLERVFTIYRDEFADNKQRQYVFFDEIQYLEGYEEYIKLIYDTHKTQLKLFLTGSLSLHYKSKVQESLAGRYFEHHVFPLFFEEYLYLSANPLYELFLQVRTNLNQAKVRGLIDQLRSVFQDFLYFYRLPETVGYEPEQAILYTQTVKLQSLNQDALNYFEIKKPQVLNALYEEIIKHNGDELSLRTLAKKGFKTTHETLTKYLRVLRAMHLVYLVYNTDQPIKQSGALKKAYTSSHFCNQERGVGYLVESYVLERLLSQGKLVTFYRQRQKEIDFLLPKEKQAIEVKYRSQIQASDFAFLSKFSQSHGLKPRVVSLKDYDQDMFAQEIENGLSVLPAMLF